MYTNSSFTNGTNHGTNHGTNQSTAAPIEKIKYVLYENGYDDSKLIHSVNEAIACLHKKVYVTNQILTVIVIVIAVCIVV